MPLWRDTIRTNRGRRIDSTPSTRNRIGPRCSEKGRVGGVQSNDATPEQDAQLRIVRVQRGFRWAIAVFALLNCWICRFIMNPDGVSYLDMGDQYWRGNWHAALNSYWSPLYSWMTGLLLRIVRPAMAWEYPLMHLLNFAILLAALFCFEFFWRELLAWREDKTIGGESEPFVWALGYLLFAYMHFVFHPLAIVTPDLAVAALVYLASGWMLRFAAGRMSAACAGLLGVLLGLGYLAKAAMFPFAVVMLATMFTVACKRRAGRWLVGTALLGFLAVSIPFIAALSWNCHRLTLGDSAKLNVAWLVNEAMPNGDPAQGGSSPVDPLHRTRKLLSGPDVYEFSSPVAGTFPVWYDPSYWCAGIDTSLHPGRVILTFAKNLVHYAGDLLLDTGFLTAVLLLMFLLSDRIGESWRKLTGFWPVLVPAVAVMLMYAMVVLETRYYSGVTAVAWGTVVASAGIAREEWRTKVLRAACLALAGMVLGTATWTLSNSYITNEHAAVQVAVAQRLRSMGMRPGGHVALIGNGFREASWARLERVTIVAAVPDISQSGDSAAAFWKADPQREQTVLDLLKANGATAVVADAPPPVLPPGWIALGDTRHAVYFFR